MATTFTSIWTRPTDDIILTFDQETGLQPEATARTAAPAKGEDIEPNRRARTKPVKNGNHRMLEMKKGGLQECPFSEGEKTPELTKVMNMEKMKEEKTNCQQKMTCRNDHGEKLSWPKDQQ